MAKVDEAATAHRDLALGRRLAAQAAFLLVAIDFADSGVDVDGFAGSVVHEPIVVNYTPIGQRYDYGSWWTHVFQRLANVELTELSITEIAQSPAKPGGIRLASFGERRDWLDFADAYGDPTSGAALPNRAAIAPVCRGPISYRGQEDVQRDIADMMAAMAAAGVSDGFLNSVAPGSCARFEQLGTTPATRRL